MAKKNSRFKRIQKKVLLVKKTIVTTTKKTIVYVLFGSTCYLLIINCKTNQKIIVLDKKIEILNDQLKKVKKDHHNRWMIVVKENLPLLVPIGYYWAKYIAQWSSTRLTETVTTRVLDQNMPQEMTNAQKIDALQYSVEEGDKSAYRSFFKISLIHVKEAIADQNLESLRHEEEFQLLLLQLIKLGQKLEWKPEHIKEYQKLYNQRNTLLSQNRTLQHQALYNNLKEDFLQEQIQHDQLINDLRKAQRLIDNEKQNIDNLQMVMDRHYEIKIRTEQELFQCGETVRNFQDELKIMKKTSQELDLKINTNLRKTKKLEQNLKKTGNQKRTAQNQKELKILNRQKKIETKKIQKQETKIRNFEKEINDKKKIVQENENILQISQDDLERSQNNLNYLESRLNQLRDNKNESDQRLNIKEKVIAHLYRKEKNKGVLKTTLNTIKNGPELLLNKLKRYARSLG